MKDFKYKTSFSSKIRCIVDEDKELLSKASLESLKSIIPDEVKDEIDLLAIAFNSCVPNFGNKNGDMIDNKTALAIYKSFIHKPINIEHERTIPIGHIVEATFLEFSANYNVGDGSKVIKASEIKEKKEPFNLSLAAVLYRLYSTKIVEAIEESARPNSSTYLNYSASWELAFDEYVLAVGSQRLDECEIITDASKIEELEKHLLGEGGSGKTPEGKPIFRLIQGDVLPLGIGVTENPAAEVAGIISSEEVETIEIKSSKELEEMVKEAITKITREQLEHGGLLNITSDNTNKITANKEKSSQNNIEVVNANNNNKNLKLTIMEKIKSTKDITDKLLKSEEVHASDIRDFIDTEVNRISDEFVAKRDEVQTKLTKAEAEAKDLKEKLENAAKDLQSVKDELKKLNDASEARERQEAFTARMNHFDSEYKLDEKTRNIVANRIKDLDEESYATQKEELEVLLAGFKVIKHDDDSDECGCETCSNARAQSAAESVAKTKNSNASTETETEQETVIDDAVANAKQKNANVANTTTQEETLSDKATKAFGKDAWTIVGRK